VLLAAVRVLTGLTLLNVVVLLGVVRRIRDHEARLSALASGVPVVTMPVGHRVGEFTATAVTGQAVTRAAVAGPTLVGFLAPKCDACHERLDDFRRAAAGHSGTALAVVVRDGGDTDALVAELDGTMTVVVEDLGGPVSRAFEVQGFPAFAAVADGTIRASGFELPSAQSA
jgi:hypothetical protein